MTLKPLYRFGNRQIRSEIPLVALPAITGNLNESCNEISITQSPAYSMPPVRRWLHRWRDDDSNTTLSLAHRDDGYLLRFPRLCDFHLKPDANLIHVLRRGGIEDHTLEHLLVDQVLPRLMAHQGGLIAHASALVVHGRTILFLGPSGAGKSTLAALMQCAGHQILSDDCTLLQLVDDNVTALPTYPSLRLLPDSLAHAMPVDAATTAMASYSRKRRVHVHVASEPPPRVSAIFLLGAASIQSTPLIEPSRPAAACLDLIRHSFQLDVTDHKRAATLLSNCGEVARNVPAFNLSYMHSFDRSAALITELCEYIQTLLAP